MNWNKRGEGNGDNIFVTSNNQTGGITAHTVNLGQQRRTLAPQLAQELQRHLPITAKVTVVAVMGDAEALDFAYQIHAWLQSAGYANLHGVDQAMFSRPVVLQEINKIADNEYELIIGANR